MAKYWDKVDLLLGNDKLMLPIVMILSCAMLIVEYLAGPAFRLFILYAVPVAFVAWRIGFFGGMFFAIVLTVVRFSYNMFWDLPYNLSDAIINALVRTLTLIVLAYLISYINKQQAKIKVLQGLLPVCCYCKKIRNADNSWEAIESYITKHSQALFTHTYCSDCMKEHFPEVVGQREREKK